MGAEDVILAVLSDELILCLFVHDDGYPGRWSKVAGECGCGW